MPDRPLLRGANLMLLVLTAAAAASLVLFLAAGGLEPPRTVLDATTTTAAAPEDETTPDDEQIPAPQEAGTTTGGPTTAAEPLPPLQGLAVEVLTEELVQPVFATTAPGDDRIYVVERRGTIRIVDPTTGAVEEDFFLNISSKTLADKGIELGLLGLAFHPDYAQNGRLFVYYTDTDHDTAVAEYSRLDADTVDPSSERIFLRVPRVGVRHNGGMLRFGPAGNLWIAIGDGGLFEEFGQDNTQFLGTILRLDIDGTEPYQIPADNPFVDSGGAPEVWAYGLRNPWRFDIDDATSTIYIGDVGQANAEEIDVAPLTPAGWNFGWPLMEGTDCWQVSDCETDGLTLPVTTYSHADGCSVTGGVVYRGTAIPQLEGHYLYADWCSGWVRSFLLSDGKPTLMEDWSDSIGEVGMITSFGFDAVGEALVTTFEGVLGRIVATG